MADLTRHRDALLALLPPGFAWPRDLGTITADLFEVVGDEFARLEANAESLIAESLATRTSDFLTEWEADWGLPETCGGTAGGIDQRKATLVAKVLDTGGLSIQRLIDHAVARGYTITIDEFAAATVEDDVETPLYDEHWCWVIQVNAPEVTVHHATVEDDVETPLAWWGNDGLECLINRIKPAHVYALFSYGG